MKLLDNTFGIHAKALQVRGERLEVLAQNIANADTPHFKARDLDFKQMLQQVSDDSLQVTRSQHFEAPAAGPLTPGMMYRVPFNAAFDGNTVELHIEQAQYGKAAADYQATLNFLQNDVSGLRKALRGE